MNKHVTAVIAESGAYHDLQIAPGTTTRDIRNQLGLGDHYLISKRGTEPFGDDENLYGAVDDGEKLFLSTPVEVGSSALNFLFKEPKFHPPDIVPIIAPRPTKFVSAIGKPMLVQRDSRPYWQQRGWTSQGNEYHGYYRTTFGSWRGKAKVSFSGRIELFMHNPPKFLEGHSHWTCFRLRLGGWYFIHTNEPIEDLASGILAIEHLLKDAHAYE